MKSSAVIGLVLAAALAGCSSGRDECRPCGERPSGVATLAPQMYPQPVSPGGASGVFRCPLDATTRSTAGVCAHCGMLLDERYRVTP